MSARSRLDGRGVARGAQVVVAAALAATAWVATPGVLAASSGPQVALRVPVSGSGGFNYTQGSYLEGFEFAANRLDDHMGWRKNHTPEDRPGIDQHDPTSDAYRATQDR